MIIGLKQDSQDNDTYKHFLREDWNREMDVNQKCVCTLGSDFLLN